MVVEVALEVEVREHLLLLDAKERTELRIRLDRVLVLELVELDIRRDSLRHIGPALLGAIAHTEERAEVVRETRGELEDGGLAGLDLLTLNGLLGLAATLVRILLEAGDALLEALELRNEGADRLTDRVGLREHGLDIVLDGRDGRLRRLNRRGDDGRNDDIRRDGRSRDRRSRLGGSRLGRSRLGGLGRRRRRNRGRRRNRSRRRNLLGLLRDLLRDLRGSGGSRAHYTRCRGTIHGGNTHFAAGPHSILGQGV